MHRNASGVIFELLCAQSCLYVCPNLVPLERVPAIPELFDLLRFFRISNSLSSSHCPELVHPEVQLKMFSLQLFSTDTLFT